MPDEKIIDEARERYGTNDLDDYLNNLIETNPMSGFATSTDLSPMILNNIRQSGLFTGEMVTKYGGRELTPGELLNQATERQKLELETKQTAARERANAAIEGQRVLISNQFARAIGEAKEIGEREISMARAVMNRGAGGDLGTDTAAMGAIQSVVRGAEARIGDLQRQRDEAMARADITAADRLDTLANNEANQLNKLFTDAWKFKLDVYGLLNEEKKMNLAKVQMDWDNVKNLAKDKTWTSPITGIVYTGTKEPEPFFKSSDLISLMKEMDMGTTQKIKDPNTGQEWTITGLGQPDVNTQIFENEDAYGNVTYTVLDKKTGQIVKQVGAGRIGKGKTGTSDNLEFKFTNEDIQKMTSANIDLPTIQSIQDDLQTNSWEDVKAGIDATPEQIKIIEQVMGAKAGGESITQESIKKYFSSDQLENMAKIVGQDVFGDSKKFFDTGGGFWKKNILRESEFIKWLVTSAEQAIEMGSTAKDIWNKMNSW